MKHWRANKLLFLILQRLWKLKLPMYSFNNIYTWKCDLHTSKYFFSSFLIFSTTISTIISKNLKKIFTKISKNFSIFSTTTTRFFFWSQNIVLIRVWHKNDKPLVCSVTQCCLIQISITTNCNYVCEPHQTRVGGQESRISF